MAAISNTTGLGLLPSSPDHADRPSRTALVADYGLAERRAPTLDVPAMIGGVQATIVSPGNPFANVGTTTAVDPFLVRDEELEGQMLSKGKSDEDDLSFFPTIEERISPQQAVVVRRRAPPPTPPTSPEGNKVLRFLSEHKQVLIATVVFAILAALIAVLGTQLPDLQTIVDPTPFNGWQIMAMGVGLAGILTGIGLLINHRMERNNLEHYQLPG